MKPAAQALTQVSLSQKGEQKEDLEMAQDSGHTKDIHQGLKYVLALNATAANEQSTSETLPNIRRKKIFRICDSYSEFAWKAELDQIKN